MAKKRKTRRNKGGRRKATGRAAGGAGTGGLVKQLQAYRSDLIGRQAGLQAEIDGLGAAIAAMGGSGTVGPGRPKASVGGGRGRRGARPGSLKSYILRVMKKGSQMAVKDIAVAVKRSGYSTNSSNFANQVSNALAQMGELTKVERGRYRR